MALKRITLTTADRRIIYILILRPGKRVGIDEARKVRAVRRRTDGRSFGKMFDRYIDRLTEFRITFNTWDNMQEAVELFEEIEEKIEALEDEEKERLVKLLKRVKEFCKPCEFTLDGDHLIWLQDLLNKHQWNIVKTTNPMTGTQQDTEIEIHPSQMEAVAEFADKLSGVISAPSISSEKESRK